MATLKKTEKLGYNCIVMQVKSIAECRSILQYFRPSLSYQLSLRPLFCLFLSGRFTQGAFCNTFELFLFLFKNFADKFIAITRLLIFNVIDIYLICLSVIKWSTDMTTFTRIDGYGVHPPLSDYLVVRKVKL